MPKQKINDPGAHHASSGALIRRFLPYLVKYKKTLFLDLFCAALTTLCDIVLPKIMSTITNSAMGVGITLTADIVLRLAALYFVLRIIDGAASYYMSSIGHIMGVHIETDMRRDAFDHLLRLDHTYYNNTKVGTIMGRITNDLFDVTDAGHEILGGTVDDAEHEIEPGQLEHDARRQGDAHPHGGVGDGAHDLGQDDVAERRQRGAEQVQEQHALVLGQIRQEPPDQCAAAGVVGAGILDGFGLIVCHGFSSFTPSVTFGEVYFFE